MKIILTLFSFLLCFIITNGIIVSIFGLAQNDVLLIMSEMLSGNTLAGTGHGVVNFILIMFDGIGGLAGSLVMYFFLADRILDLFPFSFDGDE